MTITFRCTGDIEDFPENFNRTVVINEGLKFRWMLCAFAQQAKSPFSSPDDKFVLHYKNGRTHWDIERGGKSLLDPEESEEVEGLTRPTHSVP